MDSKLKKPLLRASGIAVLLLVLSVAVFSIKGCTGRGTDGVSTPGSGDIGAAVGPETSSLFGVMETLGVFDVALNGAAVVTPVSASPMVSVSVTKLSASPLLTLSVAITNTTGSGLEGVVLRLGPLDEKIIVINNDGHDSYNFGDIASGQGITRDDIQFEGAPASFSFRLYITQKKLHAKSGVVAYSSSGGAGASLSDGKSLSKDKSLELIHRVKTLSSPRAVTQGGIISEGAHISTKADSAGNVKISYLDVDNHDLKYSFWWLDTDLSDGDQSAWRHATVDSSGSVGYFTSLALTSLGNPRIAYYSSENSWGGATQDLKYAYCNSNCETASNWGTVTIDSTGDTGGFTSIGLDFDGNPRITYYDFTNRDLKYAFCNAGAACNDSGNWRIVTIDSTGYVGQFTSLALDPNTAMPRVSYYDYSNGDLKYALCDAGHPNPPDGTGCENPANWTKTTLDSSGDVGTYTSLVLDPTTGYARISYYDLGSMDLKIAFYGQLASSNLGPAQSLAGPAYCTSWQTTCYDRYGNPYACMNCLSYYYDVSFNDQAYSPDIIQTDTGTYKLYYTNITPVCISWGKYGDCTGYRYNDAALVYKTTTDTNPPQASSSNMDIMRQSLNTGGTISDTARDPEVVRLSTLRYRLYYSYWNGSYYQLAYKDTTDTNPPSGANLGAQQLLGVGSSTLDQALKPKVLLLSSGYYRLYYGYNNGSYDQLAYRDTTTMSPPSSSNLGPVKYLNIGDSSYYSVSGPEVIARPGGYRLYYHVVNSSGGASFIAYRDTTNANPPDDTANFGDEQGLGLGTVYSDQAQDPRVILVPSTGKYRLYYSWYNGSFWQVVYMETTDTNLPTAGTTCCGWSVVTLDSSGDSGAFSSIGLDPAGSFFISYYYSSEAYGYSGDLKYATCDAGPLCKSTGYWVYTTLDTSGDTGWFTSSSVTASGIVYIGYYNSTNKNLLLGALRLFMPTAAIDPGANNGRFHSLKVDPNDYPHIGYAVYDSANRLNNAIKYTYWDGAIWKKVTIDSAPTDNTVDWQPHISLVLNSAGKPRLLYAWNRSQLKYASCDTACNNASNWTKTALTGVSPDPFTLAPFNGNIGAAQDMAITGAEQGGPEIVSVPSSGKYRIYYHRYFTNCTGGWSPPNKYGVSTCYGWSYPYGLVYRETTNTSPPASGCSNCGAETSLGIGGGGGYTDQAQHPNVIRLSDGKYRLYYSYYNGTYWQLAYRETYDNTDPPAARSTARYENTSASITKSGTWTTVANGSTSGASYIQSNITGNYAQLTFTGTGVSWLGMKSNDQGIGSVYLDTVLQGNVDLYRWVGCLVSGKYGCITYQNPLYQQTLWSITGLTYGSHTIRIQVSGTKNASSLGYYVNVDAIDVTYSYPNNMGAPVLISTGSSATDMAAAPEVFARPGGYRLYYSYYNGTYYQLAYKDTTGANPPDASCSNCGAQQLMGVGSSTNPAYTAEVVQLPDGSYRLYYGYSNGSYYQLAYYDTTNTSLPDAGNLTAWNSLNTGSGTYDQAYAPAVIQLASSGWRLYYQSYYACTFGKYGVPTGGCWRLTFKDTISTSTTTQRYVGPSLTLDSSGRPRISYWYNNAVEYSYCNAACSSAASWSPMSMDTVGSYGTSSATQTSIALDSSGNPRLAYYMPVTADLRYSYCDSSCASTFSWVKTTVATSNNSGMYASLYLDISNRPRIAHHESLGDPQYLDYSYCDSNCGNSASWLTARNVNGAWTYTDKYGNNTYYNQKGYNNPLKVDRFSSMVRIDFMCGSPATNNLNTLTYGFCQTGCSSTGGWTNRSYGTGNVGWTDFDIDTVGTVHSGYYLIGSGLYYEWKWIM